MNSDKRYKVYENNEYNRYVYRGNYWISREDLIMLNSEIVEIFDNILFKGKSHLKFRTGITILTEKIFTHWIYELSSLKNKVKSAFLYHFNKNIKNDIQIERYKVLDKELDKENVKEKEVIYEVIDEVIDEVIEIIPKKRRRINQKNNIENSHNLLYEYN